MNTTKYRTLLAGIILLIVFVSFLAVKYNTAKSNIEDATKTNSLLTEYIIKEYDEKVAVFIKDNDIPTRILDVYVSTLPYQDRQLLKDGIKVKGYEELQKRIEDYES